MSNEKSAVYNILAFNFAGKDNADETVKAIKQSGVLDGQAIVAEAIVEQALHQGPAPTLVSSGQSQNGCGRRSDAQAVASRLWSLKT